MSGFSVRILATVLAAALLMLNLYPALAIQAAIRVPVGCEGGTKYCEEDISLADAIASASKVEEATRLCQERIISEETVRNSHEIRSLSSLEGPCLGPALTTRSECTDTATDYAWAKLADLSDGPEALAELLKNAETGAPFKGHVIVEAAESRPNEQHLALCAVRTIGYAIGPPHNCATVAVITPSITLIRRASTSEYVFCNASAQFSMGGSIGISFKIQTTLGANHFSESFSRMLREELKFSTEQDIVKTKKGEVVEVSFRSTSPLRTSDILKGGWRESLDFDLDVRADGDVISVYGSTKPLVCRQASGSLVDYHGPDDAQRETYATAFNNSVSTAIKRACAQAVEIDDKTIACK